MRGRTTRGAFAAGALVALAAVPLAAGERAPGPKELPRGGQSVLPQNRVVGFYGAPQADGLGELGIGSPASAARRLRRQVKPYKSRSRQPILPVFELDISDSEVPRAADRIADWLESTGGLYAKA